MLVIPADTHVIFERELQKKKKKKKGRRRMRREHKIISIAQTDAIGVNGPIIIINIFFFFSFFVKLQSNTFLCNHITDFKLGFFCVKGGSASINHAYEGLPRGGNMDTGGTGAENTG